jgi:hypothetical protein
MIDYERLLYALKDMLLEEQWEDYDLNSIVRNASLCWDDTAILVKSVDFEFVFDVVSYECLSVSTNDLKED